MLDILARSHRAVEPTGTYDARVTATARSLELRSVAQEIADALPSTVEEVVLTGSVSRGVADDISDIEMLIVTEGEVDLGDCFLLAANCGVTDLGTWGEQGGPTKRVSGYRDAVPVELIWWSRAYADSALDSIFTGALTASADAIANGLPLRTSGLLAQWQERLRHYPDELAAAQIEAAALKWGGFHAVRSLDTPSPGRAAGTGRVAGRRRGPDRPHRLRAEPGLAADPEADRGPHCHVDGQA